MTSRLRVLATAATLLLAAISNACDDLVESIVPVNEPPDSVGFVYEALAENALAIQFTAQATDPDGRIVRYLWEFGDGTQGEGRSIVHLYSLPGIYFAVLTVDDDDGFSVSTTATPVIVAGNNLPPEAVLVATQEVTAPCELTVLYDASQSLDEDREALKFEWSVKMFETSFSVGRALKVKIYQPKRRLTFTATVRVTDPFFESDEASIPIEIKEGCP